MKKSILTPLEALKSFIIWSSHTCIVISYAYHVCDDFFSEVPFLWQILLYEGGEYVCLVHPNKVGTRQTYSPLPWPPIPCVFWSPSPPPVLDLSAFTISSHSCLLPYPCSPVPQTYQALPATGLCTIWLFRSGPFLTVFRSLSLRAQP